MPILFYNMHARAHAMIYNDAAAFYDIEPEGSGQDRKYAPILTDLPPGEICIVASPDNGRCRFTRWEFGHIKTLVDREGEPHRVFFGIRLGAETLMKSAAATRPEYQGFFNKNGEFKRHSVIRG